jgi:hypothetical protein
MARLLAVLSLMQRSTTSTSSPPNPLNGRDCLPMGSRGIDPSVMRYVSPVVVALATAQESMAELHPHHHHQYSHRHRHPHYHLRPRNHTALDQRHSPTDSCLAAAEESSKVGREGEVGYLTPQAHATMAVAEDSTRKVLGCMDCTNALAATGDLDRETLRCMDCTNSFLRSLCG